jgi:hypothetical protein
MLYMDKSSKRIIYIKNNGVVKGDIKIFGYLNESINNAVTLENTCYKEYFHKDMESLLKRYKELNYKRIEPNKRYFIGVIKTPEWKGILYYYKNRLMTSRGVCEFELNDKRAEITELVTRYEEVKVVDKLYDWKKIVKNYVDIKELDKHVIEYRKEFT